MPYLLRDTYGQEFPVTGIIQIGRDPACQILLSDPQSSRRHATVWEEAGRLLLRDENSRNGTFVNSHRVRNATLQPGDQIRIGDTTLVAAAFPGGTQAAEYGQAPERISRGLTRAQGLTLIGAGILLLCVLLVGGLILTYPYFANNLAFLPRMAAAPEPTPAGTQVVVIAASAPQKMLAPAEYQAATDQLAQAIEALNLAELQFIQDSRASSAIQPGISLVSLGLPAASPALDADLCEVAAQAMDAGRTSEALMQTAAAQAEGSQMATKTAAQFASIARLSYALVIEAQNLRHGLSSGDIPQAKAAADIAEYGAQLWNPAVKVAGVTGNPFLTFLDNQDNVAPVQFLNDSAVAALISHAESGSTRLNWLATTAEEVSKTVNLLPLHANDANLMDSSLLDTLTTAGGQGDANLAQQVAAQKLTALVSSNGQNQSTSTLASMTFSVYKGVAVAGKKMIQEMEYPSFPQGEATLEQITTPGSLVTTQIELQGDSSPIIVLDEPVKLPEAGIDLTITSVKEIFQARNLVNRNLLMVTLDVQVSWNIFGYKNPHFILTCDNGNTVSITSTTGSVNLDTAASVALPNDTTFLECWAYSPVEPGIRRAFTYNTIKINIGTYAASFPTDTDTPTLTVTPTLTQTLTQTVTLTPLPTLDHNLETEVAAQKTAEFIATVTEIARQTQLASANGVHTLNGTFGMDTNASGCFPGTHSSGILNIIVDFGQKLASGKLSGAGNISKSGISCNGMTYDLACSFSYTGTFNGTIDPASGALAGVSGPDTTISSCQYSNCKTNGVASACPSSSNGASIPGSVTLTGAIDKTSLTGKGNISVCLGCRGDWSAGQ